MFYSPGNPGRFTSVVPLGRRVDIPEVPSASGSSTPSCDRSQNAAPPPVRSSRQHGTPGAPVGKVPQNTSPRLQLVRLRRKVAEFYSATVRPPDRFRGPVCLRDSQAAIWTGCWSCSACSRASRTKWACIERDTRQPTIRRAKASITKRDVGESGPGGNVGEVREPERIRAGSVESRDRRDLPDRALRDQDRVVFIDLPPEPRQPGLCRPSGAQRCIWRPRCPPGSAGARPSCTP